MLLPKNTVLAAILIHAGTIASAQVLFNADFEAPTYQTGALQNQDGWQHVSNSNLAVVVLGGGKDFSRGVVTPGVGGGYTRQLSGVSPIQPILRTSADFRFSSLGGSSNRFYIATRSANEFGYSINVQNGIVELQGFGTGQDPTFAYNFQPDVYYNIGFDMNYSLNTISVFINGDTFVTRTASSYGVARMEVSAAGGTAYDNLRIAAVPEPATIVGSLIGIAALIRRRRVSAR